MKTVTKKKMLAHLAGKEDVKWNYCWLYHPKGFLLKSLQSDKTVLLQEEYAAVFQKELENIEELKTDDINEHEALQLTQWLISLYFE